MQNKNVKNKNYLVFVQTDGKDSIFALNKIMKRH